MKPVIDLSREYGIVLEGGGAKGAYQIGAWKAMLDAGVKIAGIAGTSVGAINGALMCMGDYEKAKKLWETISYSKVMDVDDEIMRGLFNGEVPWRDFLRQLFSRMGEGGIDVTPLRHMMEQYVDVQAIFSSPIELYIFTFHVEEMKELEIDVKSLEPDMVVESLMASAYLFPLFKNEKIRGQTYIDGGAVNNVPLEPLIRRGYKDILMVRIYGVGRAKKVKVPEDAIVTTIAPRVNLGNLIDFDGKKSRRNIVIGYYDAMRAIYGLSGMIYYIDESEEECYYLKQLTDVDDGTLEYLLAVYHKMREGRSAVRILLEEILPEIAGELKLSQDFTYRELYLAMLEATAKMCRVKKYHIYTLQELQSEIMSRRDRLRIEEAPAFVQIVINRLEYRRMEE